MLGDLDCTQDNIYKRCTPRNVLDMDSAANMN